VESIKKKKEILSDRMQLEENSSLTTRRPKVGRTNGRNIGVETYIFVNDENEVRAAAAAPYVDCIKQVNELMPLQ